MTTSKLLIGARRDDPTQTARLVRAAESGLIDYVEANYPIGKHEQPQVGALPVFVHCPANPTASVHGVNRHLARQVRDAAERYDSPWIGEHLCWLGPEPEGRVGYIVNAIRDRDVAAVAVENVSELQRYYGRSIALELGPHYDHLGDYPSELHFVNDIACRAETLLLLDVAHWTASNRNLGRAEDYGLDVLDAERIVELHIAGLRPGRAGSSWHDAHDLLPEAALREMTKHLATTLPNLKAVTFEHAPGAPEAEFLSFLETLRATLS